MNHHGVAIGIDGGASSLKWSVRDRVGNFYHGQTIGANQTILDWPTYTSRLGGAVAEALARAQADPSAIVSLGMGLSGVDRPDEQRRLSAWMREQYPHLASGWVGNDALPALRQGAGRLAGIIIIGGTGSICTGVTSDGRIIRSGGWGGALGDEGSGFWIGRMTLQTATQMADGRRRATQLLPALLEKMGLKDPMGMIPWTAALDADQFKRQVAALAPLTLKLSAEGDPGARRIVRLAVGHMKGLIFTIARRLDEMEGAPAPRTVVCAGGLFEQSSGLAGLLAPAAARRDPPLTLVRLGEPASLGALWLGLEHPLENK